VLLIIPVFDHPVLDGDCKSFRLRIDYSLRKTTMGSSIIIIVIIIIIIIIIMVTFMLGINYYVPGTNMFMG
jgi:hypothetical protein